MEATMTRQRHRPGRRLSLEVGFEPRRGGQEALTQAYERLLLALSRPVSLIPTRRSKEAHHATSLPPIIFPGRPEGRRSDEALKAEPDAPQATLEQRHQAAGDVLALRRRGFFSAGGLGSMAA